jgi:hypothetical protein
MISRTRASIQHQAVPVQQHAFTPETAPVEPDAWGGDAEHSRLEIAPSLYSGGRAQGSLLNAGPADRLAYCRVA